MTFQRPFDDDDDVDALSSARSPQEADDAASVSAFLDEMRALGSGPVPAPSPALAALLASGRSTAAVLASPVALSSPPSRRGGLAAAVAKLAGLGLAAKVGLGTAAFAAVATAGGVAGVPVAEEIVDAVADFVAGAPEPVRQPTTTTTDVDTQPADGSGGTSSDLARQRLAEAEQQRKDAEEAEQQAEDRRMTAERRSAEAERRRVEAVGTGDPADALRAEAAERAARAEEERALRQEQQAEAAQRLAETQERSAQADVQRADERARAGQSGATAPTAPVATGSPAWPAMTTPAQR